MTRNLLLSLVCVLFVATAISAQVTSTIHYQGVLKDAGDTPVQGDQTLTFRLYNVASGGQTMWQETQSLTVTDGSFSAVLGSVSPLTNVAFDRPYWLSVSVNGQSEMEPRLALIPVPYSLNTRSIPDGVVTADKIADEQVVRSINGMTDGVTFVAGANVTVETGEGNQVVISATGGGGLTTVGGENNTTEGNNAVVVGGSDNVARGNYTSIVGGGPFGGGEGNRVTDSFGIVGGGANNQAGNDDDNIANARFATVSGGRGNIASGTQSTVSGGYVNQANGNGSIVSGGQNNKAQGERATVSGGHGNLAVGIYAAVGGGINNSAWGNHATVGGGRENYASGNFATIGGGGRTGNAIRGNEVTDNFGTIGGGANNRAGNGSEALDDMTFATVGGGRENIASGAYSTVPGGRANVARGIDSYAAGRRAKANHHGTFVWADNTDANFASSGEKQFLIRAGNGVGINTNQLSEDAALTVQGDIVVRSGQIRYEGNSVTAEFGTVGGGGQTNPNNANTGNRVSDTHGTVSGGGNNQAGNGTGTAEDAAFATVGGGKDNIASGFASSIPGGAGNTASGNYGYAAGRRAKSNHAGTFVWADDRNTDFASTAARQFLIRAQNGVGINTNNTGGAALTVEGRIRSNSGGFMFPDGTIQATAASSVNNAVAGEQANNTANGDWALVAGGQGNMASGSHSVVAGGSGHSALGDYATIAGGGPLAGEAVSAGNRVLDHFGTVGGGTNNQAGNDDPNRSSARFVTVSGGGNNTASAGRSTISGGFNNVASGGSSVVGGGENNTTSGNWSTLGGGHDGTAEGDYATVSGGRSNRASGDYASVSGGRFHVAQGHYATIGGGGPVNNDATKSNRVKDNWGTVGGGANNQAGNEDEILNNAQYATVSGGVGNRASAGRATVSGGTDNEASEGNATVSGGIDNIASGVQSAVGGGVNNKAENENATVGGGANHIASGIASVVSGGGANVASGDWGSVGGGRFNEVQGHYATVAGGLGNTAIGNLATVGGGGRTESGNGLTANRATANFATVGGGGNNEASGAGATVAGGVGNMATGNRSFAVGQDNTASGAASTVGGGRNNTAEGNNAMVPGGLDNSALGHESFAAGRRAKANHNGTFVWADNRNQDFASTEQRQFLVRAQNGVGINTNEPLATLHVGDRYSGIRRAIQSFSGGDNGGSWINTVSQQSNHVKRANDAGIVGKILLQVDGSVYASGSVVADGTGLFAARTVTFSDARTKRIVGVSDNKDDLDVINRIEVTDYVKIKEGATEKKLIAQQLREVYPQAVSMIRGVVPSVFAPSKDLGYDSNTRHLTIRLEKTHGFVVGDKVDVFTDQEDLKQVLVLATPSETSFVIAAKARPHEVFVYGKWVNDMHMVDYDAVAMLNVSATQALYQRVVGLEAANASQKAQVNVLKQENADLADRLADLEALVEKIARQSTPMAQSVALEEE